MTLYRYFFYGWLFQDAHRGSDLERAAALRHNLASARWLPTYLLRWTVVGAAIAGFELSAERAFGNALVSAALAVALVLVIVYLLVTLLCWVGLRLAWRR
jgi:hypothetical protein